VEKQALAWLGSLSALRTVGRASARGRLAPTQDRQCPSSVAAAPAAACNRLKLTPLNSNPHTASSSRNPISAGAGPSGLRGYLAAEDMPASFAKSAPTSLLPFRKYLCSRMAAQPYRNLNGDSMPLDEHTTA
jgi:hypothetical protein